MTSNVDRKWDHFPSLLSPGMAAMDGLDVSSSWARFGLDIGGTLCKVVFFEPTEDVTDSCPRPTTAAEAAVDRLPNGKMGAHGLARLARLDEGRGEGAEGIAGSDPKSTRSAHPTHRLRNGYTDTGIDRMAYEFRGGDNNAAELLSAEVDELSIKGTCSQAEIPKSMVGSQNSVDVKRKGGLRVLIEEDCGGGEPADAVEDSFHCSCGTPGIRGCGSPGGIDGDGDDDHNSRRRARKLWMSSHEPVHLPGLGTLYFKCFETWRIEDFLNLTRKYHLMTGGRAIGATGGGARKFGSQFLEIAGLQLQHADELKCLVRGIDFLARNAWKESFEYPTGPYQGGSIQRPSESPNTSSDDGSNISSEDEVLDDEVIVSLPKKKEKSEVSPLTTAGDTSGGRSNVLNTTQTVPKGPQLSRLDSGMWRGSDEPLYPYLVVNIGSGVSILRADSPDNFQRVGGTSLGGSTFLGLTTALTGCGSFEEALSLAMQGDSTKVDMLVGDIYGGDYKEMGLAATTVASSFGKLVQPRRNMESQQPQHLAKAALLMVTNNIGSIAWLHASNAGVRSVMFTGSFLYNNKLAKKLLAVAMEFWSKGNMKAIFLRHEGHAGAVGALLSQLDTSNSLDALLLS